MNRVEGISIHRLASWLNILNIGEKKPHRLYTRADADSDLSVLQPILNEYTDVFGGTVTPESYAAAMNHNIKNVWHSAKA